jgi:hypothetical protein
MTKEHQIEASLIGKLSDLKYTNRPDELISAQSQKLDALKAHKKRLMQQLFPGVEMEHG